MEHNSHFEELCTINLKYLKTWPGFLKTLNLIFGLMAIALVGSGISKSFYFQFEIQQESICKNSPNSKYCPQVWLIELAFSLIILSWIFSLVILIVIVFSRIDFIQRRNFRLVGINGHGFCGLLMVGSFVLVLLYTIRVYRFTDCDENANSSPFSRREEFDCSTKRKILFRPANFISGMVFTLFSGISAFIISIIDGRYGFDRHHLQSDNNLLVQPSTAIRQSQLLSNEAEENIAETL